VETTNISSSSSSNPVSVPQPPIIAKAKEQTPTPSSSEMPPPKAEKGEKKCFSEEHLKEMRKRYREYEFETEVEGLFAKHGIPW
jgi:hypothetical protein